jgi:hypothetical protein
MALLIAHIIDNQIQQAPRKHSKILSASLPNSARCSWWSIDHAEMGRFIIICCYGTGV